MQIIIMQHGFCISGKIKDVCRYLNALKSKYSNVQDLIHQKLH